MNRRMNRRTMLRLTAFTAVSALAGHATLPALAQQKLVLKASDVHPLGYPTVEAVVRMGKALEAGTAGVSASRCIRRCSSAARRR
jgi:TRAP-type C4-dicarboxylate transport system substrate-binding protein